MKYFLGFIAGVAFIIVLLIWTPEQEGRYYDCGMAEWHPDIPKAVKEECRKQRYEHWKEQNDKNTI